VRNSLDVILDVIACRYCMWLFSESGWIWPCT